MRVAILPTGRTEWHGLAQALARLFPGHDFYALPTPDEVESGRDKFPLDGFTSNRLLDEHEVSPPESARELVGRAAQAALGDRRSRVEPADLVLILDDLELENLDNDARVLRVLRSAVLKHLEGLEGRTSTRARAIAEETREALRERVSFHLVVPMIEAYFFADREALRAAGVVDPALAVVAGDPEHFETRDPRYLAAAATECPRWSALRGHARKKLRPKWLGDEHDRARHPKGYLQWLCLDGQAKGCTRYSESKGGADALASLRWELLLARPVAQTRHLRALIEDLADALGDPSVGPIEGDADSDARRCGAGRSRVLRNL